MIGDIEIGRCEFPANLANGPKRNVLEAAIEVPVAEFNRIGMDGGGPLAEHVVCVGAAIFIKVITLAVIVMLVVVVMILAVMMVMMMMRDRGLVVMMDVRMITPAMAMVDRAHG